MTKVQTSAADQESWLRSPGQTRPTKVLPGSIGPDTRVQNLHPSGLLSPASLLQLQRLAGNDACCDLVAKRLEAGHGSADLTNGAHHAVPRVQRLVFVKETQVLKSRKGFTAEMGGMISDSTVRNYTGIDEFRRHSEEKTDYLGNIADGTWVRFRSKGMNLLGENHTEVTLKEVLPALGSTSFIDERLSSDDLSAAPELKKAYETENQWVYKQFGVDKASDKRQFGAESLFPKMGFALTQLIPYLDSGDMSKLHEADYLGQPLQRYLKIAWGHSKDNNSVVDQMRKAKKSIPPKMQSLAAVHASVTGKLDAFITSLVVDGFIGDELVKKENAGLMAPLAQFANAFTEAMVELAATEKGSRLSAAERKTLSGSKVTSQKDKDALFRKWRDFSIEDNVKAAAKRGVRYAGMGQNHLAHLVKVGLDSDQHPFEMSGKDIVAFMALTDKLAKSAKQP